jgi:hypothetical protein
VLVMTTVFDGIFPMLRPSFFRRIDPLIRRMSILICFEATFRGAQ